MLDQDIYQNVFLIFDLSPESKLKSFKIHGQQIVLFILEYQVRLTSGLSENDRHLEHLCSLGLVDQRVLGICFLL